MLLIWCSDIFVEDFADSVEIKRGINHRSVLGHLIQYVRIFCLYLMMQQSCSNITLHPALHSWTTEMSEYCFKLGRIWPVLSSGGKDGQLRLHLCVEDIVDPLGIMTKTGL